MPRGRGKFLLTLGGVTVLVAGVFIGAFLVLRSEVGEGKLYAISNPAAKSTQQLLDELYQLHSSLDAFEKRAPRNLTEDFLETVSSKGGVLNLKPDDYASDDFFYGTVLPYLYSLEEEVLPAIPTDRIIVDDKVSRRAYALSLKPYFKTFEDVFERLGEIPAKFENPFEPQLLQELSQTASLISTNFEELLALPVPPQYVEFHRKVLLLSLRLQKTIESYVNAETDPLRTLLIINRFDEIISFAEQLFDEFSRL